MQYYERLKELRKGRAISQQHIAEILGIDKQQYSDYENGKTRVPPDVLIELSRFYGTSVDYLLDLTDEKTPYPRTGEK